MTNISFENSSLGNKFNFERSTGLIIAESSLFLLVNLIAFVGNLFICLALYRSQTLRALPTNMFILSLALTDLLMSVLVMPMKVVFSIANQNYSGDGGCNFNGFIGYCLAGISLLTLTQIAVNRYYKIVKPSSYSKIYTRKNSIAMILAVWLLTFFIGIISFFVLSVELRKSSLSPIECTINFPSKGSLLFYTAVIVIYNIPMSVVIAVCYIKVYREVRHHNAAIHRENFPHGVEESTITKMFAAVFVGFYICWLPVFVTNVSNAFGGIPPQTNVYRSFYYLLPIYTSSMINPIIYAVMSKKFRREFLKVLGRRFYAVVRQRSSRSDSQSFETKSSPNLKVSKKFSVQKSKSMIV